MIHPQRFLITWCRGWFSYTFEVVRVFECGGVVDLDDGLIGGGKEMPAVAESDFLGRFDGELVKDFDVVDHDVEKSQSVDEPDRHVQTCSPDNHFIVLKNRAKTSGPYHVDWIAIVHACPTTVV